MINIFYGYLIAFQHTAPRYIQFFPERIVCEPEDYQCYMTGYTQWLN